VATDERDLPTLPELGEGESTVTSATFVVAERADGTPTLDVVEGGFEQRYRVGDGYAGLLFVALCGAHGARVYRRQRLHQGTVCVHTTVSKHDALWKQFLRLSRQLDARLYEVTQQFVRDEVERSGK
jgi:hypothetical protein